jgi:hypothetical protein
LRHDIDKSAAAGHAGDAVVVFLVPGTALAQTAPVKNTRVTIHNMVGISLDAGFKEPPSSARPWVWWMWLGTKNDPAAIMKDLEEMHASGIEGAVLFQTGSLFFLCLCGENRVINGTV